MSGRRGLLLLLAGTFLAARMAAADVASDQAAAIVVYPVIHVSGNDGIDTIVTLSNTSNQPVAARCFYVNANGHCSNTGAVCFGGAQCPGGQCVPGWNETDFEVHVTAQQPLVWRASKGLASFCSYPPAPGEACVPLDGATRTGVNGQSNAGTRVPPVSDDPFDGELKCVAVNDQQQPVDSNVLVGAADIVQYLPDFLDVARYNAVGLQAVPGANNGDNTLVLGQEYAACPNTLIVNHLFDGAMDPVVNQPVVGALALVPCSEDFLQQNRNQAAITAQFLVYNEFEQRFSTSRQVNCFFLLPLSNIDTNQGSHSIFNAGVAGTLTGQTRIRGVSAAGQGAGLLGLYFDLHGEHSTAANLHFQGMTDQPDIIQLP